MDPEAEAAAGVPPEVRERRRVLFAWVALVLAVVVGAALRIEAARSDPGLGGRPAEGLLQSDPALLHYLCSRWVEAEGAPLELRADPLIAHPGSIDTAQEYTLGQELLVDLLRPLFPGDMPLHELCLVLFSITAAAAALGVGLAARELTGSPLRGALAGWLLLLAPAAYRTMGFVLVREDLALPLFTLQVAMALRAARRGTLLSALTSGFLAALCLATWQAMSLLLLMEAGLLWLWLLCTGRNPLGGSRGLLVVVPVVAAAVLVPALSSRGALGSPLVALLLGLVGVELPALRRRLPAGSGSAGRVSAAAALAVALGWLLAVRLVAPATGDLSHVLELALAKLQHLGQFPADPASLSFEARMMWQGPFETPTWPAWWDALGLLWLPALAGLVVQAWRGWRGSRGPAALVSAALLLLVLGAWFAGRLLPAVAMAGCVLAATPLGVGGESRGGRAQAVALLGTLAWCGLLAVQVLVILAPALQRPLAWYRPLPRQDELVQLMEQVRERVPAGDAVATDFMTGPAVLTHTRRPIVLQPKWESQPARERVRRYWEAFYSGSVEDFGELLRGELDCRYLVVDRYVMGRLGASRALAGLRVGEPWRPGSPAEAFLGEEQEVQGFELLWAGERFLSLYRLAER